MSHARTRKSWKILQTLSDIVLFYSGGCIIDVGMGLSTIMLGEEAVKYKRIHFTCEAESYIYQRYSKYCKHEYWHPYLMESLHFISKLPKLFEEYNTRPSVIFLDGSHMFDVVREEIYEYLKLLNDDGVLFLHDTFPAVNEWITDNGARCGDVYRVRQMLEKNINFDVFTWTFKKASQGCGLTMIRKKNNQEFVVI